MDSNVDLTAEVIPVHQARSRDEFRFRPPDLNFTVYAAMTIGLADVRLRLAGEASETLRSSSYPLSSSSWHG